jgi:hypothetical protein
MMGAVLLVDLPLGSRTKAEKQFQRFVGGMGRQQLKRQLECSTVAENGLGGAVAGSGLKIQIRIAGGVLDVNAEVGLGIADAPRRSCQ